MDAWTKARNGPGRLKRLGRRQNCPFSTASGRFLRRLGAVSDGLPGGLLDALPDGLPDGLLGGAGRRLGRHRWGPNGVSDGRTGLWGVLSHCGHFDLAAPTGLGRRFRRRPVTEDGSRDVRTFPGRTCVRDFESLFVYDVYIFTASSFFIKTADNPTKWKKLRSTEQQTCSPASPVTVKSSAFKLGACALET
ncbi:hypothetical protein Bbelb_371260 [Branchiostoma belcheri]|nr:hypothetical protein Bbelb_371260 [Branchiostoma belcheri]